MRIDIVYKAEGVLAIGTCVLHGEFDRYLGILNAYIYNVVEEGLSGLIQELNKLNNPSFIVVGFVEMILSCGSIIDEPNGDSSVEIG
jgi:hypothetical protein